MAWHIRHEGSPQATQVETAQAVIDGIRDGYWTPEDEVRQDGEQAWMHIETHPQFAEAVSEWEPEKPLPPEEETRLDMNPLIDVALVLLIFFILTTAYDELRKKLPPPAGVPEESNRGVSEGELKQAAFSVKVIKDGDRAIFKLEGVEVAPADLQKAMEDEMKKSGRTKLAIEVDPKVTYDAFVKVNDAATGANITEVIRVVRKNRREEEEP